MQEGVEPKSQGGLCRGRPRHRHPHITTCLAPLLWLPLLLLLPRGAADAAAARDEPWVSLEVQPTSLPARTSEHPSAPAAHARSQHLLPTPVPNDCCPSPLFPPPAA